MKAESALADAHPPPLFLCRVASPQTWLAASRSGAGGSHTETSTEGTTTRLAAPHNGGGGGRQAPEGQRGRGVSNGSNTPPRVSQSRVTGPRGSGARAAGGRGATNGAEASSRPRTTVFNGIRRSGGGRRGVGGGGGGAWGGANKGRGRDSQAAGAEGGEAGAGQTLKELVMFDQILSQVNCLDGHRSGSGAFFAFFVVPCLTRPMGRKRSVEAVLGQTLVVVCRDGVCVFFFSLLASVVGKQLNQRFALFRSGGARPGYIFIFVWFQSSGIRQQPVCQGRVAAGWIRPLALPQPSLPAHRSGFQLARLPIDSEPTSQDVSPALNPAARGGPLHSKRLVN